MDRITVAIDGRRNADMPYGFEIVVAGGTKGTGKDCGVWATQCEQLGAGTLLPTSMDGDGTLTGYDLQFTRMIADASDLPIIASGGAGELEHFYEGVIKGGARVLLAVRLSFQDLHYPTGQGVSGGKGVACGGGLRTGRRWPDWTRSYGLSS